MSVFHGSKQCPLQIDADPDLPIRLKAVESAVVSLTNRSQGEALALAQSQQKFVVCETRAVAVFFPTVSIVTPAANAEKLTLQ